MRIKFYFWHSLVTRRNVSYKSSIVTPGIIIFFISGWHNLLLLIPDYVSLWPKHIVYLKIKKKTINNVVIVDLYRTFLFTWELLRRFLCQFVGTLTSDPNCISQRQPGEAKSMLATHLLWNSNIIFHKRPHFSLSWATCMWPTSFHLVSLRSISV